MKRVLTTSAVAMLLLAKAWAQPINDNFFTPVDLGALGTIDAVATNVGAQDITLNQEAPGLLFQQIGAGETAELVPLNIFPAGGLVSFRRGVWFSWTAPSDGNLSLETLGNFDSMLAIFERREVDEQTIYVLLGADDDSGLGLNAALSAAVVSGREYRIAVGGWSGRQGATTLRLRLPAAELPDKFEDAFVIPSVVFAISGSNAAATREEGEPNHARSGGQKSVWFRFAAPYRGRFEISTEGSSFNTALAVYRGSSVDQLTLVADNLNANPTSTFSQLRAIGDQDEVYYIAVDGRLGESGLVNLIFNFRPVPPGFKVDPANRATVAGTSINFNATVSATSAKAVTGDEDGPSAITMRWERRVKNSGPWIVLNDSAQFQGTTTDTLTVVEPSIEMNEDRFRLTVNDIHGTGTSRPARLTVFALPPVVTRIQDSVELDLSGVAQPGQDERFFARGLPRGLSIDPATGQVTGIPRGRPGVYTVQYWSVGPEGRTETAQLLVVVDEYLPAGTRLSFEGLLTDPDGLPSAKVEGRLNANGSYTARLNDGDRRTFAVRGQFTFIDSDGERSADSVRIRRGAGLPDYLLTIVFDHAFGLFEFNLDEVDAVGQPIAHVGSTVDAPIFVPERGLVAPWRGIYTVALGDPVNLGTGDTPVTGGHATANINNRTGRLALRGQLGDGTRFTAAINSGLDGDYRLWINPYRQTGGYLAGWITLSPRPRNLVTDPQFDPSLYHVAPGAGLDIYWTRPEIGGQAGFGPVALELTMEPWRASTDAFLTRFLLGLFPEGDMNLVIEGAGYSNADDNPDQLPTLLSMSFRNQFTVVGEDATSFTIRLNQRAGTFTGTMLLPASEPGARPLRAPFNGVMIQRADMDGTPLLGQGLFVLPGASRGSAPETGKIELLIPVEN